MALLRPGDQTDDVCRDWPRRHRTAPRRRGDRMSNCDVGSGGIWLPSNIVAQHGIEDYDHLSHDGDNSDFGLLVGIGEAKVEGCEGRIVSASAQSGHVEHVADWQPATVDATMSFEPTAV